VDKLPIRRRRVAQHVDPNLVNRGMSVSAPNGTIWVSDNGTGVSTLYGQDGTATFTDRGRFRRLRGTEEEAIHGTSQEHHPFFQVTKNGFRGPPFSFLSVKMVPFQVGTGPWTNERRYCGRQRHKPRR